MKRRRRKEQRRNAALKFLGWLALAFLLFWKELTYLLQAGWFRLRYYNIPLAQLEEANLISVPQLVEYAFHLIFALLLFALVVMIANFFNSQFLVPVHKGKERVSIFLTITEFMIGQHGPLIFVKDGEIISHLGETERKGPGVALVYSNSAVVVGDKVHGPGLVFTKPKQKINKVMDLRKQVRTLRDVRAVTRDGIEVSSNITIKFSISAPPKEIYVCLDKLNRQRDNVKVLELDERNDIVLDIVEGDFYPDELTEIFRSIERFLDGETDELTVVELEQYSAGLFVEDRVQECYTNQPRRPETGEKINWQDLPADIAEEEFRNTIVRFPYDDLFLPTEQPVQSEETVVTETEEGELTASTRITPVDYLRLRRSYPLEIIRREFSERVRNAGFLAYYFVRRKENEPIEIGDQLSDRKKIIIQGPILMQYPRLLRRSQITIDSVSFDEVIPTNPEVRQQTIENLIARWNSDAFRTEVGYDEQAAMIRSRAKTQVQQDTVYALRGVLRNSGKAKTALILRIFQAVEAATSGSENKEMAAMVKMLGDLRDWFKFSTPDTSSGVKGSSTGTVMGSGHRSGTGTTVDGKSDDNKSKTSKSPESQDIAGKEPD